MGHWVYTYQDLRAKMEIPPNAFNARTEKYSPLLANRRNRNNSEVI
jgi:hypothetical protein